MSGVSSSLSGWTAVVLRAERETIVRAWLEPTGERPSALAPDAVARVLDAVTAWLASDASELPLPPLTGLSTAGDVATVLRDVQRLREVILERVAAHEEAAPVESRAGRLDELRRLRRGLDEVALQAVDAQLEQGRREQQERTEEARRLFDAAEQLRHQAEAASIAKEEFFATISHELRTPLTSMLGWVKLLREESPSAIEPALLAKGLATIERNARSQAQLIEDMLDLSRVATGKLLLHPTAVSVADAIDAALDSARPAAEAKGIRLMARVDPEAGIIVADPERLQQIIWNLVANAVKFTPKGGEVRVGTRRAGPRCELTVEDTGQGIDSTFLPRVFDRHQQVQPGKAGGLGIGLTIVRHLVELHGGSIQVSSDGAGRGTTFTVDLPIRAVSAPADSERVSDPGRPSLVLAGAHLLVVDDEDDARELVTSLLTNAGAYVDAARSVDEALSLFDAMSPDAVVSDIGMPGKDGYALVRAIRARTAGQPRKLPVVALTAFARSQDRSRALSAGFSTYIPKPVEPTELIMVLATALGRDVSLV